MDRHTRIGLISDVHATAEPVKEALSVFRREGVDRILCAGDIAGYGTELEETVGLLVESGCESILGNHDQWHLEDAVQGQEGAADRYFSGLPFVRVFTIAGRRCYMVHASPPDSYMDGIRLLDEQGVVIAQQRQEWAHSLQGFGYDVLVVGHTHQVFAEQLANTLVVNPGSTRFNHSCAILSFPDLAFRVFPLSGKKTVKSWNWGSEFQ